jgi:hypothetical protein
MAFRIQIRRDTASKWTINNPILLNGEMGYETDTKYMKIGDGTTEWNDLLYWSAGGNTNTFPYYSVVLSLVGGTPSSIVSSKGPDGNPLTSSPWNFTLSYSGTSLSVDHNTGDKVFGLSTYGSNSNNVWVRQPVGSSVASFSLSSSLDNNSFTVYGINSSNTGAGVTGSVEVVWSFTN